jgi:hypothetical protein
MQRLIGVGRRKLYHELVGLSEGETGIPLLRLQESFSQELPPKSRRKTNVYKAFDDFSLENMRERLEYRLGGGLYIPSVSPKEGKNVQGEGSFLVRGRKLHSGEGRQVLYLPGFFPSGELGVPERHGGKVIG